MSVFRQQFPFADTFAAMSASPMARRLVDVLSAAWDDFLREHPKPTVAQEVGFVVGGVFGAAYIPFIHNAIRQNRIEMALFVARDGYLLEKMSRLAASSIPTKYVFTPRTARSEGSQEDQAAYSNYIDQIGIRDLRCCSVDLGTQSYSSQKVLNRYLEHPVFAIFSETSKPVQGGASFLLAPNETPVWSNLLEYVFSAPHPTVVRIRDGRPVYGPCGELEKEKLAKHPEVADGALAAFRALHAGQVALDLELWLDWIDAMLYDRPRREVKRLRQLRVDLGHHGKYYPVIADDLSRSVAWPSKWIPLIVEHTKREGLRLKVERSILGVFKHDERIMDL